MGRHRPHDHGRENNHKSCNEEGCSDTHSTKQKKKAKDRHVHCPICKRRLKRRSDLSRHMLTHLLLRDFYYCPYCHDQDRDDNGDRKYYRQLHNLMSHVRKHVRKQPWTCGIAIGSKVWCTKRFADRTTRHQHRVEAHDDNDYDEDGSVKRADSAPKASAKRRILRGTSDIGRVAGCLYDLHLSGVKDIDFNLPVRGATLHVSPQVGLPYYQVHITEDDVEALEEECDERAEEVENAYKALKRRKSLAKSPMRSTVRHRSRRALISDSDDFYKISGPPGPPSASSSRTATAPWFDDVPDASRSVPSHINSFPSPELPRASSSRLPSISHSYQLIQDRSDPLHTYSYLPPEPSRASSSRLPPSPRLSDVHCSYSPLYSPDTPLEYTLPPLELPCASSSRLPAPRFDDVPHLMYNQFDSYSYPPPQLRPASPYTHAPRSPSLNMTHSDSYRHYNRRVVEDTGGVQRRHLPAPSRSDPLRYYSENVRINSHPYLARRPRPGLTGAFASPPSRALPELPTPPWSPPPVCQGGRRSYAPSPSQSPPRPPPPQPVQCPMKWTDVTRPSLPPNFRGFRK
ncbi:unnamed protein product [Somion occarium]|uniref:C2H2-type domain-containing protein n=1 Tax=Somion occarium TaxID=3059160 RepID=A0ABP1DSN9_9APHY